MLTDLTLKWVITGERKVGETISGRQHGRLSAGHSSVR